MRRGSSRWFLLAGLGVSGVAQAQVPFVDAYTGLALLLASGDPDAQAALVGPLGTLDDLSVADSLVEIATSAGVTPTQSTYSLCDRYGRWTGEQAAFEADALDAALLPEEFYALSGDVLPWSSQIAFSAHGSNEVLVGPCPGQPEVDREGARAGLGMDAFLREDFGGQGSAEISVGADLDATSILDRGDHTDVGTSGYDQDLLFGLNVLEAPGTEGEVGIAVDLGFGLSLELTDRLTRNADGSTTDVIDGSAALDVALDASVREGGGTTDVEVSVAFDMPYETTTRVTQGTYDYETSTDIGGDVSIFDQTLVSGAVASLYDMDIDVDATYAGAESCASADGSTWSCESAESVASESAGWARAKGSANAQGVGGDAYDVTGWIEDWQAAEREATDASARTVEATGSELTGLVELAEGMLPYIRGRAWGPATVRDGDAKLYLENVWMGGDEGGYATVEIAHDREDSDISFEGIGGGGREHREESWFSATVLTPQGGNDNLSGEIHRTETVQRVREGLTTTTYTTTEVVYRYSRNCWGMGALCGIVEPGYDGNPWFDYKSKYGEYGVTQNRVTVATRSLWTGRVTVQETVNESGSWGDPAVIGWLEIADVAASCDALSRIGDADVDPGTHAGALLDCDFLPARDDGGWSGW